MGLCKSLSEMEAAKFCLHREENEQKESSGS